MWEGNYKFDIHQKGAKADRFTDESGICMEYDEMMIWETDLCFPGGWEEGGAVWARLHANANVPVFQG